MKIATVLLAPATSLTAWLEAGASVVTAGTAAVLVFLAYRQMRAANDQTRATRDAARAQLQPIVIAHAHGGARTGPDDDASLGEGDIMFRYYLSNEGTGPALNIQHGVEIGGTDYPFGGGMEFRSARAGEFLPQLDPAATQPVPTRFIDVTVREDQLPPRWRTVPRTYWARFENVFGERFETRNSPDPTVSATFTPLADVPSAEGS